jgi:hypothetical protein
MSEMWAVAYDLSGESQGKFQWLRDHGGDIMTFCSKWEARKWVLTRSTIDQDRNEVVFVKLKKDQPENLL